MAFGESAESVARSTPIALAWRDKELCPRVLECYETTSVDFPPEAIGKDEFDHFLANMGKLGVKRPVEVDIADDDLAALAHRRMVSRQRRRLLREHIRDTADRILESIERRPGVAKLRNAAVVELGTPRRYRKLTSPRLPLFSLSAPTVTVRQDVFAWVPCLEHTSPPPFALLLYGGML